MKIAKQQKQLGNQNLPIYSFFNLKKNIYLENDFQKSTFGKENYNHGKYNRRNKARFPINRLLLSSDSLLFRSCFQIIGKKISAGLFFVIKTGFDNQRFSSYKKPIYGKPSFIASSFFNL